jgi:hypothetical protein
MKYRILRTNGEVVEGEKIETRGNDEHYPTFELSDGTRLGVHISNVLGPVDDSCPVGGIDRLRELVLSGCGPQDDICVRDVNSGEILYCPIHYEENYASLQEG